MNLKTILIILVLGYSIDGSAGWIPISYDIVNPNSIDDPNMGLQLVPEHAIRHLPADSFRQLSETPESFQASLKKLIQMYAGRSRETLLGTIRLPLDWNVSQRLVLISPLDPQIMGQWPAVMPLLNSDDYLKIEKVTESDSELYLVKLEALSLALEKQEVESMTITFDVPQGYEIIASKSLRPSLFDKIGLALSWFIGKADYSIEYKEVKGRSHGQQQKFFFNRASERNAWGDITFALRPKDIPLNFTGQMTFMHLRNRFTSGEYEETPLSGIDSIQVDFVDDTLIDGGIAGNSYFIANGEPLFQQATQWPRVTDLDTYNYRFKINVENHYDPNTAIYDEPAEVPSESDFFLVPISRRAGERSDFVGIAITDQANLDRFGMEKDRFLRYQNLPLALRMAYRLSKGLSVTSSGLLPTVMLPSLLGKKLKPFFLTQPKWSLNRNRVQEGSVLSEFLRLYEDNSNAMPLDYPALVDTIVLWKMQIPKESGWKNVFQIAPASWENLVENATETTWPNTRFNYYAIEIRGFGLPSLEDRSSPRMFLVSSIFDQLQSILSEYRSQYDVDLYATDHVLFLSHNRDFHGGISPLFLPGFKTDIVLRIPEELVPILDPNMDGIGIKNLSSGIHRVVRVTAPKFFLELPVNTEKLHMRD